MSLTDWQTIVQKNQTLAREVLMNYGTTDAEHMEKLDFMKKVKTLFTKEELVRAGIPYSRLNSWWNCRTFPSDKHRKVLEALINDKNQGIRRTKVKETV